MVIALLAVLGVDVIVIVVFLGLVLSRRRWLKRQPGQFVGTGRISGGEIEGFGPKWKRGSGRWVREVLVWSRGPLMLRNDLIPVDRFLEARTAADGEVKRLGDEPVVVGFAAGDATFEVAAKAEQRAELLGPFASPSAEEAARRELPTR